MNGNVALNIPHFSSRTKSDEGSNFIFDEFRRKWVKLTPEEWVRQQFLMYLHQHLGYPMTAIAVEKQLTYNGLRRRPDAIVSGLNGVLLMVIEFKEPSVVLNEKTLMQAATYTSVLGNPYVLISNGINHFVCHIDRTKGSLSFLPEIPLYKDLISI